MTRQDARAAHAVQCSGCMPALPGQLLPPPRMAVRAAPPRCALYALKFFSNSAMLLTQNIACKDAHGRAQKPWQICFCCSCWHSSDLRHRWPPSRHAPRAAAHPDLSLSRASKQRCSAADRRAGSLGAVMPWWLMLLTSKVGMPTELAMLCACCAWVVADASTRLLAAAAVVAVVVVVVAVAAATGACRCNVHGYHAVCINQRPKASCLTIHAASTWQRACAK